MPHKPHKHETGTTALRNKNDEQTRNKDGILHEVDEQDLANAVTRPEPMPRSDRPVNDKI